MDVVRIFNGLGNQMSQYAFYLAKKKRHPYRTCFMLLYDKGYKAHNGYELDRLFGIERDKIKEALLYRLYAYAKSYGWRKKLVEKYVSFVKEKENYDYTPEHLEPASNSLICFYWGGWHSEKYFKEIRSTLLQVFSFNEKMLNSETLQWQLKIDTDEHSCSIHVRRGDYLTMDFWCKVATIDYYLKAINRIKGIDPLVIFYVMTNDVEWAKENFGKEGFNYVDCNKGEDSWQDMFLMTRCKYHINANSTFSWWGAWLCQREGSLTIVPSSFVTLFETKDIYPDNWIKIS